MALEHRILGLLQDTFSEDPEAASDTAYAGLLLTLDSPLPLMDASLLQKRVIQNLRSWLRSNLSSSCTGGVAVLDDGNMICILAVLDKVEGKEALLKTTGHGQATLVRELSKEAVCTVFHGRATGADLTGLLEETVQVLRRYRPELEPFWNTIELRRFF